MKKPNPSNFDEIPLVNEFSIITNTPNEEIIVYEGEFELKIAEYILKVQGKIEFKWFPITGLVFKGTITKLPINELPKFGKYDLYISSKKYGKAELISINEEFKSSKCIKLIKGIISNFYNGELTQEVSQVKFAIPNMKYLIGENVKKLEPKKRSLGKNRIRIYDNDYFLEIDKLFENDRIEDLKQKGGYHITHIGALKKLDGTISKEEFKIWYDLFYFFLCFINGRRTAPLFCSGYIEEEVIWADYDFYNLEIYKNYICWSDIEVKKIDFSALWKTYTSICKDKNNKEFISLLIHWYLESNSYTAKLEGSIILIQSGLELLFNWQIEKKVFSKKIKINKKEKPKLSAAEKISKILNWLCLSSQIPKDFNELKKYSKNNEGPEIITNIRNAFVHSDMEKVSKLLEISNQAKIEAMQLGLWYLELGILKTLGYKGYYKNRITKKIEIVPWEIKIQVASPSKFANEKLEEFLKLLVAQGKIKSPNMNRIKDCIVIAFGMFNGKVVSIGAIKPITRSVFTRQKANVPNLEAKIDYEIGYLYTDPSFREQGYSSKIIDSLIKESKSKCLMATTELKEGNSMIYILNKRGFKQLGNNWGSFNDEKNRLGLFVKFK